MSPDLGFHYLFSLIKRTEFLEEWLTQGMEERIYKISLEQFILPEIKEERKWSGREGGRKGRRGKEPQNDGALSFVKGT